MDIVDISLDARWVLGLFLAVSRVGAMALSAPQLGRVVPMPARLAFAVAIGWFIVAPVDGSLTFERLIALGVTNVLIGLLLGWFLGVLFHMFAIAGTLIDATAGTSIASIIDPTRGEQGAVFSRLFHIGGLALFHALGGLALLVTSIVWSVRAVPLDGSATLQAGGLLEAATRLTARLLVAALEVALPVLAVLLLTELVLGLAARFAPTANVFLLGLPAKTYLAIVASGMSIALFPEAVTGLLEFSRQTAVELLNGLGLPAT